MSRLSSPDEPPAAPPAVDEQREAVVATLAAQLGAELVESHIRPGDDLWVRVRRDGWRHAALVARDELGCTFFDFVSAIDWLPSPFGRDLDSQEDLEVHGADEKPAVEQTTGYAGGDSRFQMLARVWSPTDHYGITLKADLDDDDPRIESWVPVYAGADWHERETWEMYGITFEGHPGLRHLYLPADFEGHPLRKDFPLLARMVKPWPGLVDVEHMPDEADKADAKAQPEGAS